MYALSNHNVFGVVCIVYNGGTITINDQILSIRSTTMHGKLSHYDLHLQNLCDEFTTIETETKVCMCSCLYVCLNTYGNVLRFIYAFNNHISISRIC